MGNPTPLAGSHSGTPLRRSRHQRVCFNEARQEGAVEISLHHARPIPEHTDSLGEGFLRVGTGRVVVLAQPRRKGRELHQVATRDGRLLPEDGHQGARGVDLDRPAKRLLEGDVGDLLGLDDVALTDDAVGEFTVRPRSAARRRSRSRRFSARRW